MNSKPGDRRFVDTLAAVAMLLVGGLAAWSSRGLPPPMLEPVGPAAFPLWAGLLMMALALAMLIAAWRSEEPAAAPPPGELTPARPRNDLALVTVGLTLLYVTAMQLEWLGFHWSTVGYVFVLMQLLAAPGKRWRQLPVALGTALLLGLGLHYVFTQFFYIDLPT